ncbi:MAG: acyl-phosphate glycerol 3-phosphate acyltransferase [Legionella sp.]|nr:MAG: acyl-phosphate glycerol 3-phosphate acyltransferase [Legionella sp.]PJD98418.1 MAG: acyl-phosphate glycerol 3-phosphate acyltransferase [Legionella sp.]
MATLCEGVHVFLALILIATSYLTGSICSAIIVCRVFNLPDPTQEGSKNPGATNVLRLAGKKYAALVFVVDFLKGTIPVLIAHFCHVSFTVLALTMLAAVLGHVYPVFFNFKGGKGVATALGALLGFNLIAGTMTIATWLLVARFFRYSSLASITAIALSPFYVSFITRQYSIFPFFVFLVLLILFTHRNNITRLVDGSEPKIILKNNLIKNIIKDEKTK